MHSPSIPTALLPGTVDTMENDGAFLLPPSFVRSVIGDRWNDRGFSVA